jgi:carboxylesterase
MHCKASPAPAVVASPSYDAAIVAIGAAIAADRNDPLVAPTGLPRLYEHGKRTRDAVVLYHGFTNCPQQFDELARRLYDRGCNVYVPRIPLHGYRDRLTRVLSYLTDDQLRAATTESYRLARGLGERVTAVGLSLGGTMAFFLMLTQAIEHAVPVSPFLMPIGIPQPLGLAAMRVLDRLPDRYTWWDPRVKERCRPDYAYPGFPTHALAQCIIFGNAVVGAARSKVRPLGGRCTLVTNRSESAVNTGVSQHVIDAWKIAGVACERVEFTDLGPPVHDIIDPTTFTAAPTLVYPRIESIVLSEPADGRERTTTR